MGNKIRLLASGIMLMATGLFLLIFELQPVYKHACADVEMIRNRFFEEQHVIHAGGFVVNKNGEKIAYTNSYDALVNMYEKGNKICEFDIREAADGVLICAHGDGNWLANGLELTREATSEEFLHEKSFGEFQTMTVQMLADFMREHTDLLVVTDVKGDNINTCRAIAKEYPDLLKQFVIQIYHREEYEGVAKCGFPYIIFTVYNATEEERNLWKLADFAQEHELVGYTFPANYYDINNYKHVLAMKRIGIPIMFHTINDYQTMGDYLSYGFVAAIYTDQVEFR